MAMTVNSFGTGPISGLLARNGTAFGIGGFEPSCLGFKDIIEAVSQVRF